MTYRFKLKLTLTDFKLQYIQYIYTIKAKTKAIEPTAISTNLASLITDICHQYISSILTCYLNKILLLSQVFAVGTYKQTKN